jgi:predicted SnoaL-like aldol condensation-catalyzing enzyme
MSTGPQTQEPVNPRTGMTHTEAKEFVPQHFDEFVNRKNLDIGKVNFAAAFADHGADVPPGTPAGPAGVIPYVGGAYEKFPDIHVEIIDLIAEDDRVVVRNHWTGTDAATGGNAIFRDCHLADRAPAVRRAPGIPDTSTTQQILITANRASRGHQLARASRQCRRRCVPREGHPVLLHP